MCPGLSRKVYVFLFVPHSGRSAHPTNTAYMPKNTKKSTRSPSKRI